MSTFGTETYKALELLPEEHRLFWLARQDAKIDRASPRVTGLSSDRLTHFALGWAEEPDEGSWLYPSDNGDLGACERTYDMAPADLQRRMLPLLVKYRTHIKRRHRVPQ